MALEKYKPLEIINGVLLEGMKVVGELFGAGKMQLPFVLQSAETMKSAVSFLEPYMEKAEGSLRGTMVLATVKGDVHDIGKNLVDIILTNNGYKVVNLGIKQPIENIVAAAREHNASCIGMSGLLVKSTVIMKENLEILNQRNVRLPIILGGAALTRRYVEDDCRKVYKGMLFYGQDAFDDLKIMEALANGDDMQSFLGPGANEVHADLEPAAPVPIAAPPRGAGKAQGGDNGQAGAVFRSDVARMLEPAVPPFWGSRIVEDIGLSEVFSHINETALIRGQWRVRRGEMPADRYEALLKEKIRPALEQLQRICIEERLLIPKAVYGYFPCQSKGNKLIVYREDRKTVWVTFDFPRQDHGRHLCIADFFVRQEDGGFDLLPLQIATVGAQATQHAQRLFSADRYTDYLYFHGLAVESAEGLAEVVHKRIRAELGFAHEDATDRRKLFQQGYRGTRFSFGYPACPNLEDQAQLFELLDPARIEITLTEEFQLVPEQSTTAIVVVHPEAKYFNISRTPVGVLSEDEL